MFAALRFHEIIQDFLLLISEDLKGGEIYLGDVVWSFRIEVRFQKGFGYLYFALSHDLSPANPRSKEKSLIQKLTEIRIICFNRSWWIQLQTAETCKCNLLGRKCRISAILGKLIFRHSFSESKYDLYCNYQNYKGVNCQILILEQGFNDYTLAATVV